MTAYDQTYPGRLLKCDPSVAAADAEGEARAVLRLLDVRGLAPSQEQRDRVISSTDQAQLDLWFDRAVTARTAAEVFAD